jgi:aspartyl-tRNA(Asn)/glutamyl-tRNA(Gln) amidotransferase subunit B
VDANISLRGSERVEVKNITSYKGVEKALTFEITRQKNLIRRGQSVGRETRHFVEARGITTSSRSKEQEHDYRYFPEPDLRPLRVRDWVEAIALPELPDARRQRFMEQYGCSLNHARTLTGDKRLADFYEAVAARADPVLAATWVADTLLGELNYRDMGIGNLPPASFAELVQLIKAEAVTDKSGVEVLRAMLDAVKEGREPDRPKAIVDRLNLGKTGISAFANEIQEVIAANAKAVEDYRTGRKEALNFLVGQVMKKTRGKFDPGDINQRVREALGETIGK